MSNKQITTDDANCGLTIDQLVRSGMNVISGEEYHKTFVAVSHATADVLKKTLGPYGHTTVIDDGQFRYSTKDGWSLVQRLGFGDPLHNTLYSFIRSISNNLVTKVGDGTTTAIVAADAFIQMVEISPELKKYRQRDILNAMKSVQNEIIENLKSNRYTHYITSDDKGWEDIYNIAYTSTNENEEIAAMIRDIYKETLNPNIYVNHGTHAENSVEITNGYRLDCLARDLDLHYTSDAGEFYTNKGVLCFFFDHNLVGVDHSAFLTDIWHYAVENGMSCLIFSPHFDTIISEQMHRYAQLSIQQGKAFPLILVQVPYATTIHKAFFSDAAAICNATIFDSTRLDAITFYYQYKGKTLDEVRKSEYVRQQYTLNDFGVETPQELINQCIGKVKTVHLTEKYVLFEEYVESKALEAARILAKQDYLEAKENTIKTITHLDRNFLNAQLRYVRLSGKMGTINVGGESSQEKQFLKDVIDDAVLACRSAFENGYVKGMNLATLGAIHDTIENDKNHTELQKIVLNTLYDVFRDVCYAVMLNKYPDKDASSEIWHPLLEGQKLSMSSGAIVDHCIRNNVGFNIVTEEFEAHDNLHIVNSVVADEEVLKACISILSYVLTSNQLLSVSHVYDSGMKKKAQDYADRHKYEIIADVFHDVIKDIIDNKTSYYPYYPYSIPVTPNFPSDDPFRTIPCGTSPANLQGLTTASNGLARTPKMSEVAFDTSDKTEENSNV